MSVPKYKIIALICAIVYVLAAWIASEAEAASRHHRHHHKHGFVRANATPPLPPEPAELRGPLRLYPDWDNVGPNAIGDCSFAAAANYALLKGYVPKEVEVVVDYFHLTEGQSEEGISAEELSSFWTRHGIGGLKASLVQKPEASLRALVAKSPVWVEGNFANQYWTIEPIEIEAKRVEGTTTYEYETLYSPGTQHITVEQHAVLVTGYNTTGPEVVTWGHVYQTSWRNWEEANPVPYEVVPS